MQSLFHKIGGIPGIEKFLDEFYPIMLNDDRVKDYFKDIDLEALKSHQTFFSLLHFWRHTGIHTAIIKGLS